MLNADIVQLALNGNHQGQTSISPLRVRSREQKEFRGMPALGERGSFRCFMLSSAVTFVLTIWVRISFLPSELRCGTVDWLLEFPIVLTTSNCITHCKWNYGTFVPRNKSSIGETFVPSNFRPMELLFPRAKVTWNVRSVRLIIIRPPIYVLLSLFLFSPHDIRAPSADRRNDNLSTTLSGISPSPRPQKNLGRQKVHNLARFRMTSVLMANISGTERDIENWKSKWSTITLLRLGTKIWWTLVH